MSVKNAGTISAKIKAAKVPVIKAEKVSVKGSGVPKMKAPGVQKIPTLPSLSSQARRGLTPRIELARAASGASSNTRKRNSYFPTP